MSKSLAKYLKKNGLSQQEFADLIKADEIKMKKNNPGVTQSCIASWFMDGRGIPKKRFEQIERITGIGRATLMREYKERIGL